jgi:predicted thioesterase
MADIPLGTKGEFQVLVTTDVAISFLENEGARVLSTPNMIRFMEMTCRNTVLPLLDEGHDTVGTHVNVAHLGASPIGMSVTFTAEVIRVDGRRVEFRVEARDEKEKIGEGTHGAPSTSARFGTPSGEKGVTKHSGLLLRWFLAENSHTQDVAAGLSSSDKNEVDQGMALANIIPTSHGRSRRRRFVRAGDPAAAERSSGEPPPSGGAN